MKKFFLLVFVSLLVGVATAEVIDSVSFNPSRLGRYEHLKVSDTLSTVGNAQSQFVTVQSASEVTIDHIGSGPLDIGCAYVSGVDLPAAQVFTPSVYMIGGEIRTHRDAVVDGSIEVGSAALQVHGLTLDLPYHTIKVAGGSADVDNGASKEPKSNFTLGGNTIPLGADMDCTEFEWIEQTDSVTGNVYKVLGCKMSTGTGGCTQTLTSSREFSTSDPSAYSSADTCNGTLSSYTGGCTSSMLAKGSCRDYYSIGCGTSGVTTGSWGSSQNCYYSYQQPTNPTDQGNVNFANYVNSKGTSASAGSACDEIYGDMGCGFNRSTSPMTASFYYYKQNYGQTCSGGTYWTKLTLDCSKSEAKYNLVEKVFKFVTGS
ncbi:MAG: hypothetical protein IJ311_03230 [Elusimicrobiaceae bacterium]|nr:hypothetical protein [Elusimicrobiaceae bacterium]